MSAFLVSCQGSQKNSATNNQSQGVSSDPGKSIKMDITEQLSVDIPAYDSFELQQKKIQMVPVSVDLEAVKTAAFPEDKGASTLEFPDEGLESLTTPSGLLIMWEKTSLSGFTKESELYDDFLGFGTAEDIVIEAPVNGELNFMSKESVKEQVSALIKKLGISFDLDEIKIEAYTKEYLTELTDNLRDNEDYMDFIKKETLDREWTTADEVYFVEVRFEEQGVPIDTEGYGLLDESTVMGMKMELYITERGIQSFTGDVLMDNGESESVQICNVQEGLDVIAGKYKNIVTDDTLRIVGVELEYNLLPDRMKGKLFLTPVLRFDTQTSVEMYSTDAGQQVENVTISEVIRVNAETRRIIE